MRYGQLAGLLLIAGAFTGVWPALARAQAQPPAVAAHAQMIDASGRLFALASLHQAPDQVLINLEFIDRTAVTGSHALQIHESGSCIPPDFASAGGIFNPFGKQHGLSNPDGPMAGDLPNLTIGPGGVAFYNTSASLATLGSGQASLLRQGGTSLVILAQADDGRTQPEGNAGARIACGVIVAGELGPNGAASVSESQRGLPAANLGNPDLPTALLIAALGTLMIGAGIVLRRPRRQV